MNPHEGQDPIAVDMGSWRSWVEVGVFAWRGCSDSSSASSAGFSTACLPWVVGKMPELALWHAIPCFSSISEIWFRLLEACRTW